MQMIIGIMAHLIGPVMSRYQVLLRTGPPFLYGTGILTKWNLSLLETGLVPYQNGSDPGKIRDFPVPVPFSLYNTG